MKVQEWVDQNAEEVSLIAGWQGMDQDDAIRYLLGKGLDAALDEIAETIAVDELN